MPLGPGAQLGRGHGLLVGRGVVLGAPGLGQAGMLGADAGVVEPGGNGVRLGDLAVLVLQEGRQGAVQHAETAVRHRRPARGLNADQPGRGGDEAGECPGRIRPAAHARDDDVPARPPRAVPRTGRAPRRR